MYNGMIKSTSQAEATSTNEKIGHFVLNYSGKKAISQLAENSIKITP